MFNYSYTTTWSASTPYQWTQKTTTVITKDCVRAAGNCSAAPSFKTVYTYSPYADPSEMVTNLNSSGQTKTTVSAMDGMAHLTETELTSDPSGTDYVVTTYDGLGHVYTVSNPFRSTSDSTYGVTTYTYDALGRINMAVAGNYGPMMGYVYGPDGLRVAKGTLTAWSCNLATNGFTVTASYVLGPSGEQVSKMAVSGTAGNYSSSWQHTNVFANGGLLATYNGIETYFALNDWLGTKRAEITPDGQSARFFELPYGNGLTSTGSLTDATEQHFTGKERDAETGEANGNDYFGARFYASSLGRFMSPDDGSDQDSTDPQSWNLYAYVRNNPLINTDPDGHGCSSSIYVRMFEGEVAQTETSFDNSDCADLNSLSDLLRRTQQVVSNAAQRVVSYATAPRDPICMAAYSGTGAGAGAIGGGILGAIGGGAAGSVEPGGGTLAGALLGSEGGTSFGTAAGAGAGSAVGYFACASGPGGSTQHGAERTDERNMSQSEYDQAKTGTKYVQDDGAVAYVKKLPSGRYNVVVENVNGETVTVMKNKTATEIRGLARNFGWR